MPIELRDVDEIRKEAREIMAVKGISARQIMRDTGISHVTVNAFLKGDKNTYEATIIKLCLYLGLDWDKKTGVAA